MTATDAFRPARSDRGREDIRITLGNEPIAEVAPARRRTGADLEAALLAAGRPPLDEDFEQDVAETVALVADKGTDPWADPWSSTPTS